VISKRLPVILCVQYPKASGLWSPQTLRGWFLKPRLAPNSRLSKSPMPTSTLRLNAPENGYNGEPKARDGERMAADVGVCETSVESSRTAPSTSPKISAFAARSMT